MRMSYSTHSYHTFIPHIYSIQSRTKVPHKSELLPCPLTESHGDGSSPKEGTPLSPTRKDPVMISAPRSLVLCSLARVNSSARMEGSTAGSGPELRTAAMDPAASVALPRPGALGEEWTAKSNGRQMGTWQYRKGDAPHTCLIYITDKTSSPH